MTFQVRRIQPSDANAIVDILKETGLFHHLDSEPLEATRARVRRHLNLCLANDSHSVYVAQCASGEIAGYAAAHWIPNLFLPGPEGYVSELFIRAPARGQGIGTCLLEEIEQEAKRRGCARLSLINLRQRESYQRGFYRARGWEERPEAANFVYRFPEESTNGKE